MRVVIAPDKFKGSLTALQAAAAMARGVAAVRCPAHRSTRYRWPTAAKGRPRPWSRRPAARIREAQVTGPLGEPVVACFGLLGDGQTAVIEMAAASGLVLVPAEKRNPLIATTRGTGELLLAAIAAGARRVVIGIGGSATNDGGAGLGQSLGFRLLDDRRPRPGTRRRQSGPPGSHRSVRSPDRARRRRDRRRLRRHQPPLRPRGSLGRLRPAKRGFPGDGRATRPQPGPFRGDRRTRPGRGDQGLARLGRRRRAGRGTGRFRRR